MVCDDSAAAAYTQKRVAITNHGTSSLMSLLSDGLTASYMSNLDVVPLLARVLEKYGLGQHKEVAYVHSNMALVDMTELRQDVPAQPRLVMNDALNKVKEAVLGVQGKTFGLDTETDEYLHAWQDLFQWLVDLKNQKGIINDTGGYYHLPS